VAFSLSSANSPSKDFTPQGYRQTASDLLRRPATLE